jgi:putative nucleotidyltransferase with HDIG domain
MGTQAVCEAQRKIGGIIGGINTLPTPPIVFTQIQKVLNNPRASALDIAAILQEDAAMSAKVLRMTNSAYYGLTRSIESVRQAVVIMGLEALKSLVLSASVFEMFSDGRIDRDFNDYFWRHSLATAFAGRLLARSLFQKHNFDSEAGFSAGLLHDIGKMVMLIYLADDHHTVRSLRKEHPDIPDYRHEEKSLGYTHADIGSLVGQHWKLPPSIVTAIEYHHYPHRADPSGNNIPYLVHAANQLAIVTFEAEVADYLPAPISPEASAFLGISDADLVSMIEPLREEYGKAQTFVEMAQGSA